MTGEIKRVKSKSPDTIVDSVFSWIDEKPLDFITYFVIFTGLLIRLFISLKSNGVMHPDEIFQGLEMAHYLTYDSGVIPPEFTKENPAQPSYAASRSWLFPLIFSFIMRVGEFFNLDYHTGILPLIRIVLAINATLLIPATKKFAEIITDNEIVGVLTAVFVAFWWRIIEISVRPFTNSFFLPMLFYGLYRMMLVLKKGKVTGNDNLIIALFVGTTTYIRLDLGIVVFAIFLVTFNVNKIRYYLYFLVDGIIGWMAGILVDYSYYGRFFTVPINWASFALEYGDRFGVEGRMFYYEELIVKDGLGEWLGMCFIVFIFSLRITRDISILKFEMKTTNIKSGYSALFIANIITWAILSNFWVSESHKEVRFMLVGVVLLIMMISVASVLLIELVLETLDVICEKFNVLKPKSYEFKYWIIKNGILFFICFLLINQSFQYNEDRGYVESFDDTNKALMYIGKQDDVTGVIVFLPWFLSGSYTYLHKGSDVVIQYGDLTMGQENDENKKVAINLLLHWKIGNYLILPNYQLVNNGDILGILIDNNWQIETVIDGRAGVWKRIL